MVGRYGGEEFLLILTGCDLRFGRRRADEIREIVARSPISTGSGLAHVTVSLGVTATPTQRAAMAQVLSRPIRLSTWPRKMNEIASRHLSVPRKTPRQVRKANKKCANPAVRMRIELGKSLSLDLYP
jgi:hypothetical protein